MSFRRRIVSFLGGSLWLLSSTAAVAQPSDVVLPKLLEHVDAVYPPEKVAEHVEANVVVFVTVGADGSVRDVQVVESGGEAFDQAALAAVRTWRFAPATRGGKPIAARIRIPFHFEPPPPPAPAPAPSQAPQEAPHEAPPPQPSPPPVVPPAGHAGHAEPMEVTVIGRAVPPSRGASDIRVNVGELARVPRKSAAELLPLTPGFFLTKEGGEGHPERIYLRGFDAREGQDLELSVGGVPINESGNLHGNGYADLNFIIPELVTSLRVVEGPFDPRQGNYAVAGSADFELGLEKRGLTAKYTGGSFNTHRVLLLWGPEGESVHTFAGAEIMRTDGFGQNRDAKRASALGQYEGAFGKQGSFRITAGAYATEYHSAGLLREDDVAAGRKGFYDTYDFGQGGGGSRFMLSGDLETRAGGVLLRQQLFLVQRGMRLRENFTGFLLDPQEAIQSPHDQRGDLFDLSMTETMFGARGSARAQAKVLGQQQEAEIGYFARGDLVSAARQRVLAGTNVPYKTDVDLRSKLADIGIYADATLRFLPWLAVRGGARADLFAYDVLDACAVKSVSRPSETDPPGDRSCLDQQRFGEHREPDQRSSTASARVMPRGSILVGPIGGFTLSLSAGTGVRSIDPIYITQDVATPFASIVAYEGGIAYARGFGDVTVTGRSIAFSTHVDRDLVFSQTEGRAVLGGGTTRTGWSGLFRVTGPFFDQSANVTLVKATFDDTGLLVPYVPDVVVRSDTALFHSIPFALAGSKPKASLGVGISYVGRRALPYGQRSDTIFTVDTSASVAWRWFELGVAVTNLLDRQYRLAEYNYVSDFHSAPSPTLVPARHFVAGPPRSVLVSLSGTLGGS